MMSQVLELEDDRKLLQKVEVYTDDQLVHDLAASIEKLRTKLGVRASQKVYIVFGGLEQDLENIKRVFPRVPAECNLGYVVYINGGEQAGMHALKLGPLSLKFYIAADSS